MGKDKEHAKTNTLMDQQRQSQTKEHDDFMTGANARVSGENDFAKNSRQDIFNGYKSFADGTALNGLGGGGGGGYTPQTYTPTMANTERSGLSGYTQSAGKGFQDFADTGGYSGGDIANFRDKATRTSNAYFDSLKGDIEHSNRMSGGNLAFTGSLAKLARQKAQAGQASQTDAEIGLQDNIRQNKLSGLTGLTQVGGQDTSNNQFNAGQGNDMNRYNTTNLNDAAQFNASAANSAASAGAGNAAENARFQAQMKLNGLSGMQGVYESTPGELSRQDQLLFNERHAGAGDNQANIDSRASYNPKQPGVMDRVMQVAGMGAGLAGSFMNPMGNAMKRAPVSGLSGGVRV